jgi:hypothetical protein
MMDNVQYNIYIITLIRYAFYMRGASESSETRSKKKCCLNLLNFGCHLLQTSLFGNIYSVPIIFSMLQKHRGSHFP